MNRERTYPLYLGRSLQKPTNVARRKRFVNKRRRQALAEGELR